LPLEMRNDGKEKDNLLHRQREKKKEEGLLLMTVWKKGEKILPTTFGGRKGRKGRFNLLTLGREEEKIFILRRSGGPHSSSPMKNL